MLSAAPSSPTRIGGRICWLAVAVIGRPDGKRIAKVSLAVQRLAHKAPGLAVRTGPYDYEIIAAQEKEYTIYDRRRTLSLCIHRYRLRWRLATSEREHSLVKAATQLQARRIYGASIDRDCCRLPVA
ncbi:MAG TPA: hypothetical protein VFU60_18560 [Ktedonobacterales bacterium]|jgi:hypothetical protein|nr:hypothetical protein [Ktedonobacterales bacterium]